MNRRVLMALAVASACALTLAGPGCGGEQAKREKAALKAVEKEQKETPELIERRRLQGSWELTRLEYHESPTLTTVIPAKGLFVYDGYAISVEWATDSVEAGRVLNYRGPVVLDIKERSIYLTDVVAADIVSHSTIGPDRWRYYEFVSDDVLKTSVHDQEQRPVITMTWRRVKVTPR